MTPINKQCELLSRDKCMLLKKSNSTHMVPSYYVVLCLSQKYTINVDLRALNVLSSASLVLIFEHVGQSVCVSDVRPQLIWNIELVLIWYWEKYNENKIKNSWRSVGQIWSSHYRRRYFNLLAIGMYSVIKREDTLALTFTFLTSTQLLSTIMDTPVRHILFHK